MSDARAKAEARRAKILARENKKVSAINPDETLINDNKKESTDNSIITQVIDKERPLESRRKYIAAKADEPCIVPVQESDHADPEDISITQAQQILKENASKLKKTDENKSGDINMEKKKIIYVEKSMKEIEKEVEMNTKKFDETTLKPDSEMKKTSDSIKTDKKSDGIDSEQVLKRVKVLQKVQVSPASVIKLLRVLLIITLGVYTGIFIRITSKIVINLID